MTMRKKSGFTLIELMISVAILAILGSVAIPAYIRYSYRARTAEAYTMLNLSKTQEYAWYALNDCFVSTELHPVGPPGPTPMLYNSVSTPASLACNGVQRSLEDVGITPAQRTLYFQYQCVANVAQISGGAPNFTCSAQGDVDGDALFSEYLYCTDLDRDGIGLPAPTTGAACSFPYESFRASAAPF